MSNSFSSALRTGGVAVLGGSLLASSLVLGGPTPAAQAHEESDRRAKAIGADWLSSRLDDGLLHAAYADFTTGDPVPYRDYGGTVEAGYALDAVDRTRLLPRMTDALEASADSYVSGADFGEPGDHYAGPTGKLLSFVADLGGDADPTSFAGIDLVERMESLTTETGRIADRDVAPNYCGPVEDPVPCDYANVFGQIWAAHGLLAVDSEEAPAAVDYLLSTQCAAGFFPTYFGGSCNTAAAGPDATAFAVVLLDEYANGSPALAAALDDAVDWLVGFQSANGAFTDNTGTANANSTGLSGWALGLAGRTRAALRAAVWVRGLQVPGRPCDGKLARHRGAIAFNKIAYSTGRADGIVRLTAGEWQTVAVQALPALVHAPASHVRLAITAPRTVDAGGTTRVRVSGLAPGERACVGIGDRLKAVVGRPDDKAIVVRIAVGRRGDKVVRVLTSNASASARTTAV